MKKIIVLFLTIIFIFHSAVPTFGVNNSSKQIVITSENNYSIRIPNTWINYVWIEKQTLGYNVERILEKINFYYEPDSNVNTSHPLMTINVFFKNDWDNIVKQFNYTKILEKDNFVFAYTITKINPFINQIDKSLFERFIIEGSNLEIIKSMIYIKESIIQNTIKISGNNLKGEVIEVLDVKYLPLRETCENLGYKITWNEISNSVKIENEKYNSTLYLNRKNQKYKIVMKDNQIYAPISYYLSSLKVSIGIDKNSNVIIIK